MHLSRNGTQAIFLLAILLVLAVLRFRLKRKQPHTHTPKRRRRRRRFAGAAVGNALQTIHIFVDPGVRCVISERLEEASGDDDTSDLADPAIHFEHQLRRIRRGEQIDRLIFRMKKEE